MVFSKLALVGLAIAAFGVDYIICRKFRKLYEALGSAATFNKILTVTFINNEKCRSHVYQKNACGEYCSYNYLSIIVRFIEDATKSVSLCMGMTTAAAIHECLVRAHNRGVQVRYISDSEMLRAAAAKAEYLQKSGIAIKIPFEASTNLHHKFCLVDEHYPGKAKVFFGTLNLTVQGLTTNWEMIFFTKDPKVVNEYREEFEQLWAVLKDY